MADMKCSRGSCAVPLTEKNACIHSQTGRPYCPRCAKKINAATGMPDLVKHPQVPNKVVQPIQQERIMTINDVVHEFQEQTQRAEREYREWQEHTPRGSQGLTEWLAQYTGFRVDHNGLAGKCIQAIQDEYGFSAARAAYIYAKSFQDNHHSSMHDVYYGCSALAEFIKDLPA